MQSTRLKQQLEFLVEIDKLKEVLRQNRLIGQARQENDAEHSWHIATMAFLLTEYVDTESLDILKVIKMLLIHDLVEIDAGDTFCYDEAAHVDKEEREKKAAQRIFNLLPADQAQELHQLWQEFEVMTSIEARYAACLDRLQPVILNYHTGGHTWQKPDVTSAKVYQRIAVVKDLAPQLWDLAVEMIEDCIAKGLLKR